MICVAANPSNDATFVVDRLLPGSIHRSRELARVAGGKAINVARAARLLGTEPRVLALAPEHGADWLASELELEGIDARLVRAPGHLRRCLSVFDQNAGALTEFYEDGDAVDSSAWQELIDAVAAASRAGQWTALAGSLPPGAPAHGHALLAAAADQRGAAVAIDASGEPLRHGADRAALVKVNEHEAKGLLGVADDEPAEDREALELARRLQGHCGRGDAVAVVTRGTRGATLARADGLALHARLRRTPGRYPVGSGDAFLAGLLVGRERRLEWREALGFAIAAGAANAEVLGAGRLALDTVDRLTAAVEVVDAS